MTVLLTNDGGVFFEPTLLEHMRQQGNVSEILSILKDTENPWQLSDSSGRTLLHFAVEYNNVKFAQYLIELGDEIDVQDRMKQTPLMLAVDFERIGFIHVLVEANADKFAIDVNGRCALQRAAVKIREKDDNFVSLLMHVLIRKISVDSLKASKYAASDEFHRDYPLYRFMQLNDAKVTRYLLECGSPIDAKDPSTGVTALHLAVHYSCLENVELLLEYGANVKANNSFGGFGRIPLTCVTNARWDEQTTPAIMKLLIDKADLLNDPVFRKQVMTHLLMRGNRGIIRTLLQYPIDLELELAPDDCTPLYWLCLNDQPNVFEELRDFDFDVNLRDRRGYTLLHHAARVGNVSSVQYLLDRGADVKIENNNYASPLVLITNPYSKGLYDRYDNCLECVETLLDHGADPHVYTEKNKYHDYCNTSYELIAPVLAKLALLEASGRPIQNFMRNHIESEQQLKSTFEVAKRRLEEMKQFEIVPSVTLFDILTAEADQISRFARNKCLVSNLSKVLEDFTTVSYYRRTLHRRLSKLCQLIELRETFVPVINEVLFEFCNLSLYNVAEQIVDYLQDVK